MAAIYEGSKQVRSSKLGFAALSANLRELCQGVDTGSLEGFAQGCTLEALGDQGLYVHAAQYLGRLAQQG